MMMRRRRRREDVIHYTKMSPSPLTFILNATNITTFWVVVGIFWELWSSWVVILRNHSAKMSARGGGLFSSDVFGGKACLRGMRIFSPPDCFWYTTYHSVSIIHRIKQNESHMVCWLPLVFPWCLFAFLHVLDARTLPAFTNENQKKREKTEPCHFFLHYLLRVIAGTELFAILCKGRNLFFFTPISSIVPKARRLQVRDVVLIITVSRHGT
jgi:hypothetical protein